MPDIDIYQTLPPYAQGADLFEHLTRYGVDIADTPPHRLLVTRVRSITFRDHVRLSDLWRSLGLAVWRPVIETALDIDLEPIPDRAVRLITFYCLTGLTPGRIEVVRADFGHTYSRHCITRALRALQRGGNAAFVTESLEEAAIAAEL